MLQSEALDILKLGKNVFLTGPAGSGKTHVLNQYIAYLKSHAVDVAVTASTGIASTHLGGMTIHSWSGLGVRDTLTDYDLYYYNRDPHTMTGGNDKPLPVLRVAFADAHSTWVHIDPATGTIIGQTDSTRRVGRWLFAMLHSWDWLPLLERRPLWDILLILTSVGGALLSLSGIIIGYRRLVRTHFMKFR